MGSSNNAPQLLTVALTVTCCLFFASDVRAQKTWHVDVNGTPLGTGTAGDPYTSVQYALEQASTVDGDTLLVMPGTYDEVIDFVGKAVTVRSNDGPLTTILRGNPVANPPASVVTFASGEGPGSVLDGFTVRDGNGTTGGGIYVADSDPTLLNCIVRDNQANDGGGAAFVRAEPTILDCTFSNNVAAQNGGGLYLYLALITDPWMERTSVLDNVAGGRGGGIHAGTGSNNEIFARDCTISGNDANWDGGGLYLVDGYHWYVDCTIANNTTNLDGGGVWADAVWGLSFTNCRISGNQASWYGGGIVSNWGQMGLGGCTVESNHSGLSGGGLVSWGTQLGLSRTIFYANHTGTTGAAVYHSPSLPTEILTVDHCTFFENVADNGTGGIHGYGYVDIKNSILWGNGLDLVAPGGGVYCTLEYSDVGSANVPGVGCINADPLLWEPDQGDFNLRPGSLCIDSGDPTSPLDPDGSVTDMGALTYSTSYCPPTTTYCTAGTTTNGCTALMSATGTASVSAVSGFVVTVGGVEGQKQGILFWGLSAGAAPWGAGTSFRCVAGPVRRTGSQTSGGTTGACDGVLTLDFNAWMQTYPGKAPPVGEFAHMQAWFRDPPAPKTSSLSDGLRFAVCP
jgi:hypothetical protein